MQGFLARLLRASQWGATLALVAGCSTTVTGGEGGSGGGGDSPPVDQNGNELGPLPELTCEGPVYDGNDFGYHGQCCYFVFCTAPENGVCPEAESLPAQSPGSGECECGTRQGPYQANDPASDEACCYLFAEIGCDGRPLLVGGVPRLAEVISGTGAWSDRDADEAPVTRREGASRLAGSSARAAMSALASARLAERWAERARFEHASIASFARFAMELLSVGAPPELVAAAQQAGLDEVRHAQIALGIASEYAGTRLDLGPLDVRGALAGPMTLEAIAVATVVEGCVGETLAAMEAAATAAVAGPRVRDALSAIAEDETRHAELAWAFVQWAADVGGPALRARIRTAFAQAFEQVRAEPIEAADELGDVKEHGFLPAAEVARLRRRAIDEVLRPAVGAVLSGGRAREKAVFQKAA